jgi:hypothetical protein
MRHCNILPRLAAFHIVTSDQLPPYCAIGTIAAPDNQWHMPRSGLIGQPQNDRNLDKAREAYLFRIRVPGVDVNALP